MTEALAKMVVFGRTSKLPLILQSEVAECALACLAMVANYHGHKVDLASLRRRFGTSLQGMKLGRVVDLASALGFNARVLRSEMGYLAKAKMPCILHWNFNHFVVLNRVVRGKADIFDPSRGRYWMPLSEVANHFTGVLVELSPQPDFKVIEERKPVSLRRLMGPMSGVGRTFAQVMVLALCIELLTLALPYQMQLVLDQVISSGDSTFLITTTLAFLAAAGCQAVLILARGWILSWFGVSLGNQWTTHLFAHLLKLPVDFFFKRHMGDVVSRFSSVKTVQGTLTGSFIEALLHGLMGTLSLVILFAYSVPLALVILVCAGLYGLLRWLSYQKLRVINEEQLVYAARQQSELMESVRGIQAIKLSNKENLRWIRLANATHEASERDLQSQRLAMTFGALSQALFSGQRIVVVAIGALFAIRDAFSIGMLVAFVTYADQFTVRASGLIDKLIGLRLMTLHAERIAEIAFSEPEQQMGRGVSTHLTVGHIEVKDVSFRYAEDEPYILEGVSFTIEPGESVAIVGKSGCGKTTLAKIVLGLLQPTSGAVLVDGCDIRTYGLDRYRSLVAAVMQDDHLFAGSIAENIAFFDAEPSMEAIEACAKGAAIHDDISRFPMGYETLVGDMGSSLSGGQKQRVLLARALYRNAKLLVLDEATSHLDVTSEMKVNRHIRGLGQSKMVIAHRQETIDQCDRVISLEQAAGAIALRPSSDGPSARAHTA